MKYNLVKIAASDVNFSTLVSLLKSTGLDDQLKGMKGLTIFAPTNAAFKKIDTNTLSELAKDKERLSSVLLYHVIAGKKSLMSSDVAKALTEYKGAVAQPTALKDNSVCIVLRGKTIFVNNAKITDVDIVGSNGVIHVIDKVLLPSSETMMCPSKEIGYYDEN